MPTYLITLATGQQARHTISALLSADPSAKIHAVVRNPTNPAALSLAAAGAKLFTGNLDDTAVFREAAQGCTGVFLNLLPVTNDSSNPHAQTVNTDSERERATNILRACREAGVKFVVASTAVYVDDRSKWDVEGVRGMGLGMYEYYASKAGMEEAVKNAGLEGGWMILRPGWLMSNYLMPAAEYVYPELKDRGEVVHSYEEGMGFVHTDERDVGRYAAMALLEPERFRGREIDLGGEWLGIEEAVGAMGRVAGREVRVRKRTEEEEKGAFEGGRVAYPFEVWANWMGDRVHEEEGEGEGGKKGRAGDRARREAEGLGIRLTGLEEYLKREREVLMNSLPAE
ncbi:hypothetical protein AJ79_00087 [Helicocarpus griseus UAMH5409]|uniref:NmrA-like domain-containing protein n=1 Tax=Helicocarpus griseus UAMH5409 TaxID=1447875 RepID=A0A2B7YDE1_9EURO|nr:hypothetical protein AJ79_00087 [Helicocarpus griseus UAMH5409]